MNRRLPGISFVAGFALAGACLSPAAATAETAKIGSDLSHPMDLPGALCTNCTTLQQAQVGGNSPLPLTSPANGVVTSWAVRTGDPGARYTLRILRPSGTNIYLGAGISQAPAAVPGGTTDSTISYPAASLPIKQGDSIGVFTGGGATGVAQRVTSGVNANLIANNFTGGPPEGSTATFIPDVQHELLLQATIEFCKVPDLTGQTLATAQDALTRADCGAANVTKKRLKRTKKNKKKKGKILSQTPPGTTSAPGTTVDLTVGALKKKKR